jgi:hypothetical protein
LVELLDPPEPTVNLVLPDLTVQLVLRAPPVFPELRAQMALLVEAALLEPRVLKARPAPRGLRVNPEIANVFAQEPAPE